VRIYNPTGPQVNAKVPDLWMSNVAVLNNSDHHTRKEERKREKESTQQFSLSATKGRGLGKREKEGYPRR